MRARRASRVALAVFFTLAGIAHFAFDAQFAAIVPPLLPLPLIIVWLTGFIELGFAAALLQRLFLPAIGKWLSLYLLAVLPANIYMAWADVPVFGVHAPAWMLWGRLPLQLLLIAWILWATQPVEKTR